MFDDGGNAFINIDIRLIKSIPLSYFYHLFQGDFVLINFNQKSQ